MKLHTIRPEIRLDDEWLCEIDTRLMKTMAVCEHIDVNGYIPADRYDEMYEYAEHLQITCKQCNKVYDFKVLVN